MYNDIKKRLKRLEPAPEDDIMIVYDFSEIDKQDNPKTYTTSAPPGSKKDEIYIDLEGFNND